MKGFFVFRKNKYTLHKPIDKNDAVKCSQKSLATVIDSKSNISVKLQTENAYDC